MPEEFFEVAHVNDKLIVHGKIVVDRTRRTVEHEMNRDQRRLFETLQERHQKEEDALLREFIVEGEPGARDDAE